MLIRNTAKINTYVFLRELMFPTTDQYGSQNSEQANYEKKQNVAGMEPTITGVIMRRNDLN